jgi:hypothetical protein
VPLNRVKIAAGSRSAEVRLPRSLALSREAFDNRLMEAAVEAGVEFRPNTLISLSRDTTGSECVTIIASGLTGGDATPEPGSRIGAGVVLPAAATPDFFAPGTIYMATACSGYVGFVRVEDGRLDIAAAFDAAFVKSAGGLGPAAEAILRTVGWPLPDGLGEAAWKGTPALTRRAMKVANDHLFVVGDAAGYVEPFTGEGMAWAVMSAAALAPIAARATRQWRPSLIREWEVTHARIVGQRQKACRAVARVLRSPLLTAFCIRALKLFPGLASPVVTALNRPSPLPKLVFQ